MNELYKAQFSKVIKAFHGSVDNLNNYSIEELIKANLKNKNAHLFNDYWEKQFNCKKHGHFGYGLGKVLPRC